MAKLLISLLRLLLLLSMLVTQRVSALWPSLELDPPVHNFTQKVEHSTDSNVTFQQQYQLVTQYFKKGGPILFVQSAEAPLVSLQYNIFLDWAEELGAIVATLEHRYFGTSYPESFNFSDPTASDYAPLTLDNIMKDSVEFVRWIKKTVAGSEDSKVFYNGGSYGGFLAVEAIIREPDTFYGSIASSPMIYSFGGQGVEGNPHHYSGLDFVSNIWFDSSAEAARKIQSALSSFSTCIEEQNCPEALPDLGLCTEANVTQWAFLHAKARSSYMSIAQMNYAFANVWPWANPLQAVINLTLDATTPGQVLRIPLLGSGWTPETGCIDPNNRNITGEPTFFGDSFQWIRCTYFPGSFGDSRPGSLIPTSGLKYGGDCWGNNVVKWQAPDFNMTNRYWVEKLNLTVDNIDRTERLLIVQGSYDIATAYGSPDLTLTSDRNHSRSIYVQGMAHTEDTYSYLIEPRGVRPAIDQIRDIKKNYLIEWAGLPSNSSSTAQNSTTALTNSTLSMTNQETSWARKSISGSDLGRSAYISLYIVLVATLLTR